MSRELKPDEFPSHAPISGITKAYLVVWYQTLERIEKKNTILRKFYQKIHYFTIDIKRCYENNSTGI